ncbi:phosphate ABC transporter permease PstA [Elioraea thermophila]|uniref:phosphate ABC transporter permease PstA n=1 Tax=Elioraea thermophila TaxID=2185104 RepID=UPI000DF45F15|nr:phosphate ABC transporter permease PstA [Elioraea thermophila]
MSNQPAKDGIPLRSPQDAAGAAAAAVALPREAVDEAVVANRSASRHTTAEAEKRLRRRYAAQRRFKAYGITAIAIAVGALLWLLITLLANGLSAFQQTYIRLEVTLDPALVDPRGDRSEESIRTGDFGGAIRQALRERFPDVVGRERLRNLFGLLSSGAEFDVRDKVLADPSLIGTKQTFWVLASTDVDMLRKGFFERQPDGGAGGRLNAEQVAWFDQLKAAGDLDLRFNKRFFTNADSREPEMVGILGGVVGSFLTLSVCLVLCFPFGVAAAIYLEEFAPKNWFTDLIEVNINNLAAVPSIIFGLLGLAVFLNFFGMPRSAPLVGGIVLALMSLPTIIIASRAALRAVPPSIREAAYGLGASKMQVVLHHVLPLGLPGMMTGSIIAMAQALGETAPLLMIGMVAFIVGIPKGLTDSATVLPVQIFMWADNPERGFVEKTSAAILVLLAFLLTMNAIAIFLRKKFERRW